MKILSKKGVYVKNCFKIKLKKNKDFRVFLKKIIFKLFIYKYMIIKYSFCFFCYIFRLNDVFVINDSKFVLFNFVVEKYIVLKYIKIVWIIKILLF